MTTTVQERYGSLSATGFAKESVFGTAVAATTFLPMTGNQLELDPGLFWPSVMMGQRDLNIFALYGQFKNSGSVAGPLFPSNAGLLLPAAIGLDGGAVGAGATNAGSGQGVTGSSPTSSTTLSAAITTVGATTVNVTSATGYAVGNFIQVDVNNTVTPVTAEVRKITNIVSNAITVDSPLSFTHANAAAVSKVVAPFTHTIIQANQLPSLTVEKNLGGVESLQFSGAKVDKYSIQVQTTNSEVGISADMIAKHSAVLATPTAISVANESPYVFAEGTLSLNGQTVAQASNVSINIDNGLTATYTMNGSHDLQFLTPVTRKIGGKADVVFHNFDDATWGYWTQMATQTNENAFTLTFLHQSTGETITVSCPYTRINNYSDGLKMTDVIMSTISFDMGLNLGTMQTISATMINSTYLPY